MSLFWIMPDYAVKKNIRRYYYRLIITNILLSTIDTSAPTDFGFVSTVAPRISLMRRYSFLHPSPYFPLKLVSFPL